MTPGITTECVLPKIGPVRLDHGFDGEAAKATVVASVGMGAEVVKVYLNGHENPALRLFYMSEAHRTLASDRK